MTDRDLNQGPSERQLLQAQEVQGQVLRGEIPSLKDHRANWRTTAALLISTMLVAACTKATAIAEQPGAMNPATSTTPAEGQGSNGTGGGQAETTPGDNQSSNPDSSKPLEKAVNCGIVSPELCATADRFERQNARGETVTYIGLKIPAGTRIFTPIEGQVRKVEISQGASLKGFQATVDNPNSVSSVAVSITGDLAFDNMLSTDIKPGETVGQVMDRGITNFGDYNIVVSAGRFDSAKGYAISADETLKELFPNAFNKPAKMVASSSGVPYFGGNVFIDSRNNSSSN